MGQGRDEGLSHLNWIPALILFDNHVGFVTANGTLARLFLFLDDLFVFFHIDIRAHDGHFSLVSAVRTHADFLFLLHQRFPLCWSAVRCGSDPTATGLLSSIERSLKSLQAYEMVRRTRAARNLRTIDPVGTRVVQESTTG